MHNEVRRSLKALNSQTFGYWMEKSYSSLWPWQASLGAKQCGPVENQQEAKQSCWQTRGIPMQYPQQQFSLASEWRRPSYFLGRPGSLWSRRGPGAAPRCFAHRGVSASVQTGHGRRTSPLACTHPSVPDQQPKGRGIRSGSRRPGMR
jgi:hypothetical protein